MPVILPRPLRLLAPLLLTLAGCAGIPQDRGLSDVNRMLAERGAPEVQPASENGRRLADELLAHDPLTQDDAVRVALLLNPRLQTEYARLGYSAAEVYDAARPANPRLSGAMLFTNAQGAADRYDYGLSQDFLGLLLLPARKRQAQAGFERSRQEMGAAVLALSGEVQAAWQRLLGAQQVQTLRQTIADGAQAAAQLAQRYYDAGNIPDIALERQQAEAARAEAELVAAQTDTLAARAALADLMGVDAGRDWRMPQRMAPPLDRDESLPELLWLAQRSRLDLAAQRREIAIQEDALGLTRGWRWLGPVEAGVQGERDTDGTHLLGPSLSLELPLFNQGQGRLLRAQTQVERSRAELARMELAAANAIRTAQARMAAARALARRYLDHTIPLHERIVAHEQERNNFMLSGAFELIQARREEYDSYQQYLETLRDYWVARAELGREVGARLPGDQGAAGAQP